MSLLRQPCLKGQPRKTLLLLLKRCDFPLPKVRSSTFHAYFAWRIQSQTSSMHLSLKMAECLFSSFVFCLLICPHIFFHSPASPHGAEERGGAAVGFLCELDGVMVYF